MALILLLAALTSLFLGYRLYARRILYARIPPDRKRTMPARRYQDGMDFIPVSPGALLGYQFKSISLDPILGPIIAIQFGWLPVVLWLILGVVFAGWIQDYAVALISARNGGAGLGELAGELLSPLARIVLLVFIYFYLLLTIAAFAVIIAPLFSREGVPVVIFTVLGTGLLVGQMLVRWRFPLPVVTLVAILLGFLAVYAGGIPWTQAVVRSINNLGGGVLKEPWGNGDLTGVNILWGCVLLGISYLGAILPIWRFTLPVNYTAALVTLITMGAATVGILVAAFTGQVDTLIRIPALVTPFQPQLGPLWPILFVTISSGAISGWHALVNSFGTSRLLDKEGEILPVTAGASFLETGLAILSVVFAVTVGVTAGRYAPDQDFRLVAGPASVFVSGLQTFLDVLGIQSEPGAEIGVILLTLMALGVMQLLLRFTRMVGAELAGEWMPVLRIPGFGALVGLVLALFLIVFGFWQHLWVLFGGSNQVLAGVALLLVSVWLARDQKSYRWTFWPALFLLTSGVVALLYVSLYRILYQSIFLAYRLGSGFVFGNAVTAIAGLCLAFFALVLLVASLRALNQARDRIRLHSKGDDPIP
jgi:carbon starvation protein